MSKGYLEFRARKMPPIPANWNLVEFRELIESPLSNGIHKSAEHIGHGNSWLLDINGLYAGLRAMFDDCRPIDIEQSELLNYQLSNGDILINRVSVKPEGVGKAVLVENVPERTVFESNMIRARVQLSLVHPNFLVEYLSSPLARRQVMEQAKITAQASISQSTIGSLLILLPPIQEQVEIAQILGAWDQAIELTERLIEALKKRKKGLMQRLLFGVTRFPMFIRSGGIAEERYFNVPEDWEYVQISEFASQSTAKNISDHNLPVLSCTKYDGLVDSLEYFGRKIYSDNTATYRIVERGQFAYATNHIEEGSIGYQDLHDRALISPMYTVFLANDRVNDEYLYRVLKTETYRRIFEISTNSSVNRRGSLRWNDFSRIKIPLPGVEEQTAIAKTLIICEREVEHYQEYLRLLMEQKKGLMQRLLTGQVRVKVN